MKLTASNICFNLALLFAACVPLNVSAQDAPIRPVTSAWTIEAGSAHVANTYLTPLKYSGWNVGLGLERWQAMRFNPNSWVMRLDVRANMSRTLNSVGNSIMWGLDFSGSWAMMWRKQNVACQGLTFGVGPEADLEVGALYLPRNGNNPVQARASLTLDATAYATYSFQIGKLPMVVRYQPAVPLLGAFFCPDYGELYYEIYLGNHTGLAHFAWPGSYRRFKSLLSVDLRFGATALRIGYRADLLSSKANEIIDRNVTHMLSLGISGEWLMLRPSKTLSRHAEIISAFY